MDLLSRMSQKGLILRIRFNGDVHYMAAMFVIGILIPLKNLDREMAEIFDEYMKESFGRGLIGLQTPQLRVVPVKESLDAAMEIQPYDELRKIIESQKTIVLADCICRKKSSLLGHPCSKPRETCFVFGAMGEYYAKMGWAGSLPKKKRSASWRRMKKPAWYPAQPMPRNWVGCAVAARVVVECSRPSNFTPNPAAW